MSGGDVSIAAEVAALLDDESLDIVTGRAARGEGSCQICGGHLDNAGTVAVCAIASPDGQAVHVVLTHHACAPSTVLSGGARLPDPGDSALTGTQWTTIRRDLTPRAGLLWEPNSQPRANGTDAMLAHLLDSGWARPTGSLLDTSAPEPADLALRLTRRALRLTGAGLIGDEFDIDDDDGDGDGVLQVWLTEARADGRVLVLYGTGLALGQRALEPIDWAIRMRRCAVAVAHLPTS